MKYVGKGLFYSCPLSEGTALPQRRDCQLYRPAIARHRLAPGAKASAVQELTGAIRKGGQAQYLDKLQVERERGITVKVRLTCCAKHMQASALLTLELYPTSIV